MLFKLPGMWEEVLDIEEKKVLELPSYNYSYATLHDTLRIMPLAWPNWTEIYHLEPKSQIRDQQINIFHSASIDFLIIFPLSDNSTDGEALWINWVKQSTETQKPRAIILFMPTSSIHDEKLRGSRLLEKVMSNLGYQTRMCFLDNLQLGASVDYQTTVHIFHRGMCLPAPSSRLHSKPRGMGPDLVPYPLTPKRSRKNISSTHPIGINHHMPNNIGHPITTPDGNRNLLRSDLA